MPQIIFVILVVLGLLFAFRGCGSDDTASESHKAADMLDNR